jgi:hypothetical protein
MAQQTELLSGTCQQLLFSPKGGIEGLLLTVKGKTVQVSMPPDIGVAMARKVAPGKRHGRGWIASRLEGSRSRRLAHDDPRNAHAE